MTCIRSSIGKVSNYSNPILVNLLYPYEIQNQRPHVPTFGSIKEGDRSTTKAGVKVEYSEVAVCIPIAAGRHRDKQANEGSNNL
jgi:hypothetical protein